MAIDIRKPVGDAKWAPFFVRVPLGAYFVLAGLEWFGAIGEFIVEVQKYNILPHDLAMLYAVMLPWVEVATGALLLIGFWTTLASILTSLMLISFIIAVGLMPGSSALFNTNIILLGASLSLMYSGPGAISMDRFRSGP